MTKILLENSLEKLTKTLESHLDNDFETCKAEFSSFVVLLNQICRRSIRFNSELYLEVKFVTNLIFQYNKLIDKNKDISSIPVIEANTVNCLLKAHQKVTKGSELSKNLFALKKFAMEGIIKGPVDALLLGNLFQQLLKIKDLDAQTLACSLHSVEPLLRGGGSLSSELIHQFLERMMQIPNQKSQSISMILTGVGNMAMGRNLSGSISSTSINSLLAKLECCKDLQPIGIINSFKSIAKLAEVKKLIGTINSENINKLLEILAKFSLTKLEFEDIAISVTALAELEFTAPIRTTTIESLLRSKSKIYQISEQGSTIELVFGGLKNLACSKKLDRPLSTRVVVHLLNNHLANIPKIRSEQVSLCLKHIEALILHKCLHVDRKDFLPIVNLLNATVPKNNVTPHKGLDTWLEAFFSAMSIHRNFDYKTDWDPYRIRFPFDKLNEGLNRNEFKDDVLARIFITFVNTGILNRTTTSTLYKATFDLLTKTYQKIDETCKSNLSPELRDEIVQAENKLRTLSPEIYRKLGIGGLQTSSSSSSTVIPRLLPTSRVEDDAGTSDQDGYEDQTPPQDFLPNLEVGEPPVALFNSEPSESNVEHNSPLSDFSRSPEGEFPSPPLFNTPTKPHVESYFPLSDFSESPEDESPSLPLFTTTIEQNHPFETPLTTETQAPIPKVTPLTMSNDQSSLLFKDLLHKALKNDIFKAIFRKDKKRLKTLMKTDVVILGEIVNDTLVDPNRQLEVTRKHIRSTTENTCSRSSSISSTGLIDRSDASRFCVQSSPLKISFKPSPRSTSKRESRNFTTMEGTTPLKKPRSLNVNLFPSSLSSPVTVTSNRGVQSPHKDRSPISTPRSRISVQIQEINQQVADFLAMPRTALDVLAKKGGVESFLLVLRPCSEHQRYLFAIGGKLNFMLENLPLKDLSIFIKAIMQKPYHLYVDSEALLKLIESLGLRLEKVQNKPHAKHRAIEKITNLQKFLVEKGLEYHTARRHPHVVKNLEKAMSRLEHPLRSSIQTPITERDDEPGFLSDDLEFLFDSSSSSSSCPVRQYESITLGDGNCLYNSVSKGIKENPFLQQRLLESLKKLDWEEFISVNPNWSQNSLTNTLRLGVPDFSDISESWINTFLERTFALGSENLQKTLSPLLRFIAVSYLEQNHLHPGATPLYSADVLQDAADEYFQKQYGHHNLALADDTSYNDLGLLDHQFITTKLDELIQSHPESFQPRFAHWFQKTGQRIYLQNIKVPATSGSDRARWGSEIELNALAESWSTTMTWNKENGTNLVGVMGGIIPCAAIPGFNEDLVSLGVAEEIMRCNQHGTIEPFLRFKIDAQETLTKFKGSLQLPGEGDMMERISGLVARWQQSNQDLGLLDQRSTAYDFLKEELGPFAKPFKKRGLINPTSRDFITTDGQFTVDIERMVRLAIGFESERVDEYCSIVTPQQSVMTISFYNDHWSYLNCIGCF